MPDDLREQMIDAALSEFGGEWWSSDDRLAAEYMVYAILALPEIAAGLALRSLVVGQGLSVGMGAHEGRFALITSGRREMPYADSPDAPILALADAIAQEANDE